MFAEHTAAEDSADPDADIPSHHALPPDLTRGHDLGGSVRAATSVRAAGSVRAAASVRAAGWSPDGYR
jgi:hypothetical protein